MGTSSKLDRAGVVWLPGHSEGVAWGVLRRNAGGLLIDGSSREQQGWFGGSLYRQG